MADNGLTNAGSPVFRWVFELGLGSALYLLLAFALEALGLAPPSILPGWLGNLLGVAAALLVGHLIVRLVRVRDPRFLMPVHGVETREGLASILLWCVPTYLALMLIVGGGAFMLVSRADHHWPLVVYGLAVWGSAWLCVAPATIVAWLRARARMVR